MLIFPTHIVFFHAHKQRTVTQERNLYAPREGSMTEVETCGAPEADQMIWNLNTLCFQALSKSVITYLFYHF